MSDDPTNDRRLDALASGFRGRTLVTAKLASRMGLAYVKRTLGRDRDPDPPKAIDTATELVRQFGALKGLVMKFGQMASYLPGAFPPEAQAVLAELQSASTAMSYDKIAAVVEAELGAPPERAFERFEREPFAAASIGQVHRARHEGREVAVKVQYPGIDEVLRSDVSTVGLLAKVSTFGTAIDGGALAEELGERLAEECDYLLEARHQAMFARLFAADPRAHVPSVVGERTTRRVLTTELAPGRSFYDFAKAADPETKNAAAETIFGTCFRSIFRHCAYNADPHPGNYLFEDEGRVTFLDFGCIRRFSPPMIDAWKRCALSVVAGDRRAFRDAYVALGFVPKPDKFDWDHQWEMMSYLYLPFLQREPFTYTHEYVQKSYAVMIFDNPNRMRTAMPREWLLLNRLQWGLNSILAHLGATGDWPRLWREAIESPTEPAALE
jgi:predicted unusual protein kinase regulating ubiquinone biosynthesis (AarF/ABC1/UbiB family)